MAYTVICAYGVVWAMAAAVALRQPVSELMSMAPIIDKDYKNVQGLVSHLRPGWYLRAMMLQSDGDIWVLAAAKSRV